MLKKILLTLFLFSLVGHTQNVVKGKMEPAKNYPWVALYKLEGSKQAYITNANVTNGEFLITIPVEGEPGIYRLIYDLENRLFVDFIYNNEDISLSFHPSFPTKIIKFRQSYENNIYHNYLKDIIKPQKKLDSLQIAYFNNLDPETQQKISALYEKSFVDLKATQLQYEQLAAGKLANHFIMASAPYYAEKPVSKPADYLTNIKTHFFDAIDFNKKELLNSAFINDKINNFIFYTNTSEDNQVRTQLRKEAITAVIARIGSNHALAKDIEEGLLYAFTQQEDIVIVNYLLNYYIQLPKELQDIPFINDMKGQLRTAIGMKAPAISWPANDVQKELYDLTGHSTYIIVFWSSTCSHCLIEMPLLYDYLKNNAQVKVIAVGLEEETSKVGWESQIANYENFAHIYGHDKWENKIARDYGVNATPSFFVLDADKKVIAKPDDVKELMAFFDKNNNQK